ncbi:uncharacterized protein OCT59_003479 [Rhizophagus irregularis]|uniref:Uncharacterized protein n=1 Tax=Rhizophagus irregularis (strain DAOM 181602 / DAOM 197198 / MUCL 43194) TaxID=747089 RepID=U9SWU3_RHIID|nr:hypothetical protein OCT59_003479 [Rhizophagus irregularis]
MGANSPSLWPTILKYRTNYCTFLISFCKKGIRIRRMIQVGYFETVNFECDKSRMVSIISVRVLNGLHDFRVWVLKMSFGCLSSEDDSGVSEMEKHLWSN